MRHLNFKGTQSGLLAEYLKLLEGPDYDVLEKSEEQELVKQYREGSVEARDQLVMHNFRLIPYIINQYNIYSSDPMDLIQAGNVGLLEAAKTYDPEKGVRFATYAIYIIKKHVLSAVSSDLNKVYIPFGMTYRLNKYRQLTEQAWKEDRELSDSELMTLLDVNRTTLKTIKAAAGIDYTSLSSPISTDADGKTYIADTIQDENSDVDRNMIEEDNHRILIEALSQLTPREYDIVVHTYGFECEKETSKDLADRYKISMERVYQIKKSACEKMRKIFINNGLDGVDF